MCALQLEQLLQALPVAIVGALRQKCRTLLFTLELRRHHLPHLCLGLLHRLLLLLLLPLEGRRLRMRDRRGRESCIRAGDM